MSYIFSILCPLKVFLFHVLSESFSSLLSALALEARPSVRVDVVSRLNLSLRAVVFNLFVPEQFVVLHLVHVRRNLSRPRAQLLRAEVFEFLLHRFALDGMRCAPSPERRGHELFGLGVGDGVRALTGHALDLFEDLAARQLFASDGDATLLPTHESTAWVGLGFEFSVKTQGFGLTRSNADDLADSESVVGTAGSGLVHGLGDDPSGHVQFVGDASVCVPALDAVFTQDVSLEDEIPFGEIFVLTGAPGFVFVGLPVGVGVQDDPTLIVISRLCHLQVCDIIFLTT